jgi:hypothetical protein
MIRFVGKKEQAAAHPSDLVGRFVGKEGSMLSFRTYTRPMLVTGYSGTRLYVKASLIDHKSLDGSPKLLPVEEWDEEFHIQIKSVVYVCDTKEEGEQVMAATRLAKQIWQDGETRMRAEINTLFADLVADQPDADGLPQP